MIYAQRLQVTSRIRQRYANTTPAIRQCHASATPTLRQCSASATSVLRQCYTKDTPPAHKLRSVLTGYARPKGLTTYDQELTTYAIGSGFTPTKAQESRPQAHNLHSGAHRPRSCHKFIVDVQEPTVLLNSWSASPPTRPLRHRRFGRQQPQQVFFDFTKHRHYRNLLQVSCITWNRFFPSIEPCLCFLPPGEEKRRSPGGTWRPTRWPTNGSSRLGLL